jgi:hypothetical protein
VEGKIVKGAQKTNGLCFRCGEKFLPGHKCTEGVTTTSVAQIVVVPLAADGGELMSEEILNALEWHNAQTDETCFLSLNAQTVMKFGIGAAGCT